jgi:DNA-directed RNA polymerase subunit RPC12/RpoP
MIFFILTVAPTLVLLHPRHVFIMFRSNNVYKCFNCGTTVGASSSKPLIEASWCIYLTCKILNLDLRPLAH